MRKILTPALVAGLSVVPLGAEMRSHSVEIGPYLSFAGFDDESNIENDGGLGGRLGIVFERQHELELSADWIDTEDDFGGGLDVELATYKVGYIFNIVPGAPVVPFLTSGVGIQSLEVSEQTALGDVDLDQETDPLAYLGFGARFFLGPVFNLRAEGQAVAVFPDSDADDLLLDGILNVGVGWVLGGR